MDRHYIRPFFPLCKIREERFVLRLLAAVNVAAPPHAMMMWFHMGEKKGGGAFL